MIDRVGAEFGSNRITANPVPASPTARPVPTGTAAGGPLGSTSGGTGVVGTCAAAGPAHNTNNPTTPGKATSRIPAPLAHLLPSKRRGRRQVTPRHPL
ncbi:hypothetical protein Aglo03_63470 [Actinokineospora globicatena]|uniref:Uncharacterized protein n=1 Tax=Actinokineospora globicatena TaxID=103729 RepID=A0A9W6QSW7_9PSEU|nr:hypothetical protein Aglo03_63470 [Actinokineospora globicatena]